MYPESDWRRAPDAGRGPAFQDKDDQPPSWDGRSTPLQTYLRKIEIWEAYTKTDPARRGIKLLSQLEGDAFDKLELVRPQELRGMDGVARFVGLLREKYEPLEHRRVGQIMDAFMYRFERGQEETVNDFNLRFDRELTKAEKVAGSLTPV
jgi:hypothetical protein